MHGKKVIYTNILHTSIWLLFTFNALTKTKKSLNWNTVWKIKVIHKQNLKDFEHEFISMCVNILVQMGFDLFCACKLLDIWPLSRHIHSHLRHVIHNKSRISHSFFTLLHYLGTMRLFKINCVHDMKWKQIN